MPRGRPVASLAPDSYKEWLILTAVMLGIISVHAFVTWGRPLIGGPLYWILWAAWLACTVFELGRRAWLIRVSRALTYDDLDVRLWSCSQVLGLASFALSWISGVAPYVK
ncbi:hypothetical protein [Corallococcus sp. AB049A]|uniref:hypothetical protein n=1 Tax=Corallococcus sp. AB049A TaxID=2316721 RepID=UPI0011C3F26B|nr:hypothetical protein [Corallococcus sp. AB049A]